jgi:hemerythrin-like metal-binding protein
MAYFEWADDLVIDNGPIDQDHRQLVDLVNELHTATSQGCGQAIVARILDELIRYTVDHLQREEQLMASLNFPNLVQHKAGHDKFMEQVRDLKKKYDGGSITVASQLSTTLRDWLSLHIRRNDKEILTFHKKSGATKKLLPGRTSVSRQEINRRRNPE